MNDKNSHTSDQNEILEPRILASARAFPYPPTPEIRRDTARQAALLRRNVVRVRLQAAAILLALILAITLGVPPVRAALLDWISIGAVRIYLTQPAPTATPAQRSQAAASPVPQSTATPLKSILDLSGETSLSQAQSQAGFSAQLPTFPTHLGQPDHVFFQELGGPILILVWTVKDHPGTVQISISETNSRQFLFQKFQSNTIQNTQVDGSPAVWMDGSYLLITGTGETTFKRLVDQGHTLIWTEGDRTYRLETNTDLDTAIRTAQSLK